MSDPRLTVYHDGACPLCSAEIALYRRARGADAVAFVDVSTFGSDTPIEPDLPGDTARARFHVRSADGRLWSGAAGFAALWRALPRWHWLGRVVGSRAVLPVAELAYRGFLPLRPYLARIVTLLRR